MDILGEENKNLIDNSKIAVIGPITRKTAEDLGFKISIEPKKYTVEELAEKIKEAEINE